ncbi:MAG: site-2 protease family protein [Methanobacteriota archaeon]
MSVAFFVVLLLVIVHTAILLRVMKRPGWGDFDRALGFVLLWRTQYGKRLIDWLSGARRFWNAFADVGIVLTFVAGGVLLFFLVFQVYAIVGVEAVRQDLVDNPPSVQLFLGLPGVNPAIPLGYGILALVVALVIHEFSHGILARAADLRVKSLGLLFVAVPLGAFVEPDEEDLQRARTRVKNRIFAAGPTSNLVLAAVAAVVLSSAFLSPASVVAGGEGVGIVDVFPGTAAASAGLAPGMVVRAIDGQPVRNATEFHDALADRFPGEAVTLSVHSDGRDFATRAVLTSRYDFVAENAPDANDEAFRSQGFLGVGTVSLDVLAFLHDELASPIRNGVSGVLFYVAFPFFELRYGISPFQGPYQDFFVTGGPLAALPAGVYWGAAYAVYWIFWLNFALGTFNALPAGPLDGGQMFRASVTGYLRRREGIDHARVVVAKSEDRLEVRGADAETQRALDRVDRKVGRVTSVMGYFILFLILAPIFLPRLL